MNPEHDAQQIPSNSTIESAQKPIGKSVKKYVLYIMVIGLVLSALISVVAVLAGEFNEFIGKSLYTTFLSVIHSLVILAVVSKNERNERKSDAIIINTVLGIAIVSFIASVFGTWGLINGDVVYRVYGILFYTFMLCFVTKALLSVTLTDRVVRSLSYASLGLATLLYVLLIPTVLVDYDSNLPDVYYRIMTAIAILFGTSSVLTAIFQKLRK